MTEATMTPATAGNDSAQPSITLEDAANLDFYDPDEEQETVEAEGEQHSDVEAEEAEEGQASEEIEASEDDDDVAEDEEQGEEDSTPEPSDDATITIDGQKFTIAELKKGYFREADYTRQKQRVSQKEQQLEALSARVNKSVEAIADFLVKQIPEAPDPALAMTNPGEFVQKEAMHKAAVAQVNALLSQVGDVSEVAETLTEQQRNERLSEEFVKLSEAFPTVATEEGRKKFFDDAASAAKELGYSEDEIKAVVDHRMFKLAHYAMLGLRAEQAKAKAKKKVQDAPPVAPPKRQKSANASRAAKNREAMKRLSKTGSIADAMAIDFD